MTDVALRMDKWLWHARFFKTRALASRLCTAGRVRVDGVKIGKAHFAVRPGQVLTFPQGRRIRVVRVIALGDRRGSAKEASLLYEDMSDEATVPYIAPLGPLPQPWVFPK
ncbi:MAG: RNA-binding S4 domain-containing protein [Proteobacteria bacterium]|nr:RNA-binding S4 domain-containing protein [Pseudomonadota bacterium]MDA1323419.1 RNA-binding S4 domain-containing protein [Pseudomonadota bacterium]